MATTAKKSTNGQPVRNATLFADEAYWATLLAKLTGSTVAKVVSKKVRDGLRKELKARNIDPDVAWSEANGS